jgi:hypothetical protein
MRQAQRCRVSAGVGQASALQLLHRQEVESPRPSAVDTPGLGDRRSSVPTMTEGCKGSNGLLLSGL